MKNNTILRSIIAIIAGLAVGMFTNMGIITISPYFIPSPKGADVTTAEGLQSTIHLFQPKHFLFPFLAHALGTFAGAFTAVKLTLRNEKGIALFFGLFFLLGGISAVTMFPAPMWFNAIDLILAYIPMSLLAWKWATKKRA